MKIHGYEITAEIEGRVLNVVTMVETFRSQDVIAALLSADKKNIQHVADTHVQAFRSHRFRVNASEIAMRSADALLKAWKKRGVIVRGEKRGDWVVTKTSP